MMIVLEIASLLIPVAATSCGLLMVVNAIFWPRPAPAAGKRAGASGADPQSIEPKVSVLIPARNEAETLPELLSVLTAQGADRDLLQEILVLDDRSSDGTHEVIQRVADRDSRVRVLAGRHLPRGWCGKPWALAQLAEQASAPWLLMLDADARPTPGAITTMVAEAERRGVGMISFWPGLDVRSFGERWLMPMLDFVMLGLFPTPLQSVDPRPALGLAHGACILVNRAEYFRMGAGDEDAEFHGGHAVVRNEIFEDTALARAFRRAGGRSLCLDGQALVRVRMYDSVRGIWNGFVKNFYPAFRSPITFWLFLTFHVAVFLVPFLVVAVEPVLATVPGAARPVTRALAAVVAVLVGRSALLIARRQALWSVLFHPLSEVFVTALALTSWWRVRTGAGVEWKGRVYHRRGGSLSDESEQGPVR